MRRESVYADAVGSLQAALVRAQKHGIAKVDARMLLLHAVGKDPLDAAWLIAHEQDPLTAKQATDYGDACARRRAGEPVAYIVGHKEFHGLRLATDARVLDPRDDTETLVDWALELTAERVLDLGTGSGAIALAIKSNRPDWKVCAVDASADALTVARANAARLGLDVDFRHGDWLAPLRTEAGAEQFDLVVSNPPYIPEADPHLAALKHEPLAALASGTDGLDDIRRIVADTPAHLREGGWLLLEHGHDQAAAVRDLLRQAGFGDVGSRLDLSGIERCSGGKISAASYQK
ncbi:protein-(glutamine-N5) methyltransferase, release factor-specific [Rhodoferax koreense]|uniref:Release factor glutamine methyltransferase n=1 Tax=Rhodoferax koreensis TaxID=1842727 RepID=A0A1P8K4D0_9BURK|nr:protein-(glutamine-N5) methyltransferase, release factor-specific [Rhodoferax koreense]